MSLPDQTPINVEDAYFAAHPIDELLLMVMAPCPDPRFESIRINYVLDLLEARGT